MLRGKGGINVGNGKKPFIKPELEIKDLSAALYQANLELTQANHRLQENETRQQEFFANISHDLRSPVATIKNNIEYLLQCEDIPPAQLAEVLQQTQTKVLVIENFLEQILQLTTLEESNLPQFKPVDVRLFLETFFYDCAADKKYAACQLNLDIPEGFSHKINADPDLLARVLENLFSNAVRYSPANAVISLGVGYAPHEVTIWVADQGMGIESSHIKAIFERSYTINKTRTPGANAGHGLGLAIAKEIVARHGGRIWCESTPRQGSTFFFTLPTIKNHA